MTPEERALALAMYRLELSDVNVESGDWPAGVTSNLGELDWQAEKLIRAEWARWPRDQRAQLLRAIGAEVMVAIEKENGIVE